MAAIFAVVFLLGLLTTGIVAILAGIIGILIFRRMRKKGKPVGKALTVISAIVLGVGCLMTVIPGGFFAFIVYVNSVPPEGFVETGIVIVENGFQDTRFTADGVVYEVLDLKLHDSDCNSTPVFTYKESGFLNRSQWGNYYLIENAQGFSLVRDNYTNNLYCPIEEREDVIDYYTNDANIDWYYDDWNGTEFQLADSRINPMEAFLTLDLTLFETIRMDSQNGDSFEIQAVSKDEIVLVESYWFVDWQDSLYYIVDTEDYDEGFVYILIELSGDIEQSLLSLHRNGGIMLLDE